MAKRLFLLIFISLIGVISYPQFLIADDTVNLTGINTAGAVETVPLPEPEPEPEPEPVVVQANNYASRASTVQVANASVKPSPQVANYVVSFYIGSADEYVNTANNLSYNGIYKYRKMVYGHNSANLLGNLKNRYVGEIIAVTDGGVTKNYRVADIQTYRKTEDGNLEGNRRLMTNIVNTALGHDLALLTCAGQSYGNGDASHRLVVYVDEV